MNITVNDQALIIAPNTCIQDLLAQQGHAGKRLAVELNGAIAPRSAHSSTMLKEGDKLEIVIAVGGG